MPSPSSPPLSPDYSSIGHINMADHISSNGIDFVSLGMLIIDEIEFPSKPSVYNILGGAGTYSAVGARLLSPGFLSRSVGWVADAGNDFPESLRNVINSWKTGCYWRETPERKSTRGWNGYGENEHRGQCRDLGVHKDSHVDSLSFQVYDAKIETRSHFSK
jgi:hypothetical protein